jgi:nucleoid-associated protein YgaU
MMKKTSSEKRAAPNYYRLARMLQLAPKMRGMGQGILRALNPMHLLREPGNIMRQMGTRRQAFQTVQKAMAKNPKLKSGDINLIRNWTRRTPLARQQLKIMEQSGREAARGAGRFGTATLPWLAGGGAVTSGLAGAGGPTDFESMSPTEEFNERYARSTFDEGFLYKCADRGLNERQAYALLEKSAQMWGFNSPLIRGAMNTGLATLGNNPISRGMVQAGGGVMGAGRGFMQGAGQTAGNVRQTNLGQGLQGMGRGLLGQGGGWAGLKQFGKGMAQTMAGPLYNLYKGVQGAGAGATQGAQQAGQNYQNQLTALGQSGRADIRQGIQGIGQKLQNVGQAMAGGQPAAAPNAAPATAAAAPAPAPAAAPGAAPAAAPAAAAQAAPKAAPAQPVAKAAPAAPAAKPATPQAQPAQAASNQPPPIPLGGGRMQRPDGSWVVMNPSNPPRQRQPLPQQLPETQFAGIQAPQMSLRQT